MFSTKFVSLIGASFLLTACAYGVVDKHYDLPDAGDASLLLEPQVRLVCEQNTCGTMVDKYTGIAIVASVLATRNVVATIDQIIVMPIVCQMLMQTALMIRMLVICTSTVQHGAQDMERKCSMTMLATMLILLTAR